jgi:phage tail protein X
VAAGDTLSYLALKYYGDQYKWEKIYEANKPTMKSPHSLYVGQKISIPLLDGKLIGEQTLPISNPSPVYPLERPAATNISDAQ